MTGNQHHETLEGSGLVASDVSQPLEAVEKVAPAWKGRSPEQHSSGVVAAIKLGKAGPGNSRVVLLKQAALNLVAKRGDLTGAAAHCGQLRIYYRHAAKR